MTIVRYVFAVILFGNTQLALSCEFSTDVWPGEGRPVLEVTSGPLTLFDDPDSRSQSRAISAVKGTRIEFTDSYYCTQSTGVLRILTALSVAGRKFGQQSHFTKSEYYSPFEPAELEFRSGDLVTIMQYRAEGYCFVRWGGELFEVDLCTFIGQKTVEVVDEPITEWWVKLSIDGAVGWALVDQIDLQVVGRTF